MPVVINEFEVMPEPPDAANQTAGTRSDDAGGSKKPPMSDFEIKQMLERAAERMERVSAH
jgi:hypothetical protein